jgi:surface polysaccharide O-acyltransferase-like enzyme
MEHKTIETIKSRFAYIDNLRSCVILLVIAMHSAITYSGYGDWHYIEGTPENLSLAEMFFFGFFQSFLQAWFMGILFFIAAFFAAKTLPKRSSVSFIKERLFRLGLPLLIYVFIIHPFMLFGLLGISPQYSYVKNYMFYITDFTWLDSTGPLWFAEALLIFCILYAAIRKLFPKKKSIKNVTSKYIMLMILLTGIAAFFIRIIFPIGIEVQNLKLSYFASYIVLFVFGVIAGENNLLDSIAQKKHIVWLKFSLSIGIPLWCLIMIFGGALEGKMYFNGGLNWQSFAFAFWEAFTAIGFSIGLIALFRLKVDTSNTFSNMLAENSFGIYVFHTPILIGISLLLKNWNIIPSLKFIIVAIIVFMLSLLFTIMIRKIKWMKMIFK